MPIWSKKTNKNSGDDEERKTESAKTTSGNPLDDLERGGFISLGDPVKPHKPSKINPKV